MKLMDDIRFADMLEFDPRWLNLSISLWCSIIAEADRDFLDINRTIQEINDILDVFEAQLMRRVSGLLYISDVDSGNSKKRALIKLKDSNL